MNALRLRIEDVKFTQGIVTVPSGVGGKYRVNILPASEVSSTNARQLLVAPK